MPVSTGLAVDGFPAITGCIVSRELRSSAIPREFPSKLNPEGKESKSADKENSDKAGSKKHTWVNPLKKQPDAGKRRKQPKKNLGGWRNREEKKELLPTKPGGNKTGKDLGGTG